LRSFSSKAAATNSMNRDAVLHAEQLDLAVQALGDAGRELDEHVVFLSHDPGTSWVARSGATKSYLT